MTLLIDLPKGVQTIVEIMERADDERYGGECVSQLVHGLQCAAIAKHEGASESLITAALLHDIGHLVDKRFEVGQRNDIDRRHEDIGAAYLSRMFPASVTEPIRLHVDAKRYLCSIDNDYAASLSPASQRSLRLQGGTFTAQEAQEFIARPFAIDAVKLRKWDDLAKDPDAVTPRLDYFIPMVARMAGA